MRRFLEIWENMYRNLRHVAFIFGLYLVNPIDMNTRMKDSIDLMRRMMNVRQSMGLDGIPIAFYL